MSGGSQRLESGSYVDISGVATVLGLAARKDLSAAALTGGVFFEYGTSRFSTHNSFDTGDVDGKGHASYTDGGLLARIDITESLLKGLYLEGVFRFGGMTSDWHSDDLRDATTGRCASYDLYSPYTGAHLGLGYIWQATDTFTVDFYGKWLWTRVYGDDVRVIDHPYEFADVDSYRLRFGARADWNITEQFGLYAGAAWEHEFDGKAQATAYGLDTPAPTVKGDTGVFDFGFSLKPSAVPGLTMELGATATAGVRHGIMGNMTVKYEF
ncbi:MAG: autotransporter outer membrane beta-barrel domain-containing protein [Desulfovibrio sp.]|nr:autotransporter outer membrane beta-barrel domain-containing protein [Desulfovibrio sp.]